MTNPKNSAQESSENQLPRWDLSDLYPSMESQELKGDLKDVAQKAHEFQNLYSGRVKDLGPQELADAITHFEMIEQKLGRIGSYGFLLFATQTTNAAVARFFQDIQERLTDISKETLFFTLEINKLPDDLFLELSSNQILHRWLPWLEDVRLYRPHQLSDAMEKLLLEKSITGRQSWCRLFDETMAGMMVSIDGQEVPLNDALNRQSNPNRTTREKAAKAIGKALSDKASLLALITNTLAKDKATDDKLRHYKRPVSSRNLANLVEDNVVDALVNAVKASYPRLSHRYYTYKAKWLGLDKLQHWDRNAPFPGARDDKISWEKACEIVFNAYHEFSPTMGEIAQRFLTSPWIDAPPIPGKEGGAFAHSTVPDVHPYIMLNYHGRTRDVMTLAHEVGHGIHQTLAARQGYFLANTPLTLAETASVFGEMLTFHSLLERQKDPLQRRLLLASKVEDMLNTVVRQIAFYEFETAVHDQRRRGEISREQLGHIWLKVQKDSLGPAFEFTPDYEMFWSYIPHFIHTPFYVYAYAFGDCLVNVLYRVWQDGMENFQEKYLTMLKAGGTLRHRELLAPFGLDASSAGFWNKGLDVISSLIDELEQS